MVVSAVFQAIAQIRVGAHFLGLRLTTPEYLDKEVIVCGRCQVGELFVGIIPLRDDTEVELANIEVLGSLQTRRSDGDMMSSHISEDRIGILGGSNEIGHWASPDTGPSPT
ncbi:hypothetical protein D3C81_1451170 [compost metagenome]